jgi:hypothetical protein
VVPAVPPVVTAAKDNAVLKDTPLDWSNTNVFLLAGATIRMTSGAVVPTVGLALLYSLTYVAATFAVLSTVMMYTVVAPARTLVSGVAPRAVSAHIAAPIGDVRGVLD